jgi:hypothetical protein
LQGRVNDTVYTRTGETGRESLLGRILFWHGLHVPRTDKVCGVQGYTIPDLLLLRRHKVVGEPT